MKSIFIAALSLPLVTKGLIVRKTKEPVVTTVSDKVLINGEQVDIPSGMTCVKDKSSTPINDVEVHGSNFKVTVYAKTRCEEYGQNHFTIGHCDTSKGSDQ